MQTVASALGRVFILYLIVGLTIVGGDGLPCLPDAVGCFSKKFHQLVILTIVFVPCNDGFAVGLLHMEVREAATHTWQVWYLFVAFIIAHASELAGIPLSCGCQGAVIIKLAFRLAVPIEIALHIRHVVELAADSLHSPLIIPVGLAALECTILVP